MMQRILTGSALVINVGYDFTPHISFRCCFYQFEILSDRLGVVVFIRHIGDAVSEHWRVPRHPWKPELLVIQKLVKTLAARLGAIIELGKLGFGRFCKDAEVGR